MVNPVARLVRANLAAVLAFWEEWQPPIAPRRTMQDAVDALNEYEAEHETLPESEPVTTSAGESIFRSGGQTKQYGPRPRIATARPQSSPNPHGDLSTPAEDQAVDMARGGEAVPHDPTSGHPHNCGEGDDYWQGAPGDKHTCRVCGDTWIAVDAGPLDIEWVRDEPTPSLPTFDQDDVKRICGWVRAAVRTDKADDALLRGFLRLIDVAQQK